MESSGLGRRGRKTASTFRNRVIPMHYQLQHIFRSRIESGEIVPHQQLPTEAELCREYQVCRATVRQALAPLVRDGLLSRRQGRGTFFTEKARRSKAAKLTGCTEDLPSTGPTATVQVLDMGRGPAPANAAQVLGVPAGTAIVQITRLHSAEGRPFAVVRHYLPVALGDQIAATELGQETVLQVLERTLGLSVGKIQHRVEAIKAAAEYASLLGIGVGEPVLSLATAVYAADGQPVEAVESIFCSERYRYTVELARRRRRPAVRLQKPAA
jgi:GntR family transcriptional regulator